MTTRVGHLLLWVVFILFVGSSKIPGTTACSFFVSNFDARGERLQKANFYSQFRGPDVTRTTLVRQNWTFLHNLLSMTGNATTQPFVSVDETVVAVFNGEIYNYRELEQELEDTTVVDYIPYASDGAAILPAYARYGDRFLEHVRGEFALVLVDFARQIVLLSTDVFSTKPLYYGTWPCHMSTTCFAAASYESALEGMGVPVRIMAEPNQVLVLSFAEPQVSNKPPFSIVSRRPVFRFDLNQHKTTTDDWQTTFLDAVRIRTEHVKHKLFIGLSAGYDTGAIMLALELLQKPFYAYYVGNQDDDESIIRERVGYCAHAEARILRLDRRAFRQQQKYLSQRCEKWQSRLDFEQHVLVQDTSAAVQRSAILSEVRDRGGLVFLTGTGADEIMTDYAKDGKPLYRELPISCFGGRFPANLTTIFPWCNFYYGTQRDFLMNVEMTAGAHGIEGRYPFLDPLVVQEFLWLVPALKNSYKRPVADFLQRFQFPNMYDKKAAAAFMDLSKEGTEKITLSASFNSTDVDISRGIATRFQQQTQMTQAREQLLVGKTTEEAGKILKAHPPPTKTLEWLAMVQVSIVLVAMVLSGRRLGLARQKPANCKNI